MIITKPILKKFGVIKNKINLEKASFFNFFLGDFLNKIYKEIFIMSDETIEKKDDFDFIKIIKSMLVTCDKIKDTINRIQRSSENSPFQKKLEFSDKENIDKPYMTN